MRIKYVHQAKTKCVELNCIETTAWAGFVQVATKEPTSFAKMTSIQPSIAAVVALPTMYPQQIRSCVSIIITKEVHFSGNPFM